MQHWLIATATGICLGLLLYFCVRLRMHLGPIIKQRFGALARQIYWITTIFVMILLANLALRFLRIYLSNFDPVNHVLLLEGWFAILALIVAMGLIVRRLYQQR
jgi:hypothetical protein